MANENTNQALNVSQALFGGTMLPQDMQQELIRQRAAEFAQLTPSQQLAQAQYTMSAKAGQGLAQAMGVDITDPAIKRQSELTQLAQGVEGTPEGLRAYAKRLEATGRFPKEAVDARRIADDMEQKQSVTFKNMRDIIKVDKVGIAQGTQEPVYVDKVNNEQFIIRDGKRVPFSGAVDQTTSKVGLSADIKMANQELDWRNQFLKENSGITQQASNVRQSLSLLNQQDSPFADAAFKNTVVSAFGGDKQKSKAEIDRLVNTGDLEERLANSLKGFLEGTTSVATKEDQRKVLEAIDKSLEKRYNNSADAWRNRLSKSNVNHELVVPGYSEVVGGYSSATKPIPPEGTRMRNKKTNKIEVVRNGKFVPEE